MKKIIYPILTFSIMAFYACGGSPAGETESHENHDGHDHAAMEAEAEVVGNEMIPAAEGARVFFVNLQDGQEVTSPLTIEMGVEGMTVHPAGEVIEGTGHHHLILEEPGSPMGEAVPADDHHIHFGGGQTETEVELAPGPHMLTLQFADGLHRSYGEEMSVSIHVEVKE